MQSKVLLLLLSTSSVTTLHAETNSIEPAAGVAGAALTLCGLALTGVALLAGLIIYLIPTVVACHRNHVSAGAILAVNLLTGWTLIGWISTLIWACTNPAPPIAQKL